MNPLDLQKAALRGEPSHVWRAGQERRLSMIREAAGERLHGRVLVDGCGVGTYVAHLRQETDAHKELNYERRPEGQEVHGLDIEYDRVLEGLRRYGLELLVTAAGESLPYPSGCFDLVLSHEVIEHVQDDRAAVAEMIRVLRSPDLASGQPGGRIVLFCPNRWYPVETHGVYWRGRYRFGNVPLINYLPDPVRNRLAPHVRAYTGRGLRRLFEGLPVRIVRRTIIFGGYDNLIAHAPRMGPLICAGVRLAEKTPLRVMGLSHLLVAEKTL